jgi:MFS family permease
MFTMLPWGLVSDRYGRKPVLVISLFGMIFTASSFGFSQNVWQMILLRCLGGLFSGAVVYVAPDSIFAMLRAANIADSAIRASITENSTKETQASAFSLFAFYGNIGLFAGTLLGGALANPAEQYPSLFGKIQFFRDFPYALPTLTVGVITIITLIITVLFVKEVCRPPFAAGL